MWEHFYNRTRGANNMKMQISTEYAIRILQYLHEHGNKGELHTSVHIAEAIDISYPFFIKIANQLKKGDLLHSVQGRNGGYKLGKCAYEISLYDVFVCVEGALRINRCLNKDGAPCSSGDKASCKLRKFWHRLQEDVIIAPMSKMRISDLVHPVEDKVEKERLEYRAPTDQELQALQEHYSRIIHFVSVLSTDQTPQYKIAEGAASCAG